MRPPKPSRFALLIAAAAISACQSPPATAPVVPSPLQLIESSPLELADDCAAAGSFFVEFVVDPRGRTTNIQPAEAPACVREALTAWVSSFRYMPLERAMPSGVEWLMTTAKRGS